MDGLLLLNKPLQWTSHDAVDFLRRKLGQKKIGHAGTLDPMATGLLVLLLGKATKLSAEMTGLDKDYRGSIRLGVVTDSWDLEGKVLSEKPVTDVSRAQTEKAVTELRGPQSITPPAFSALKKEGKRYYAMAREGLMLEPPAREVMIADFGVEDFVSPEIFFFVSCSKGTYVRSLAYLVGQKLGCGACLSSLIRTRIGDYSLENALTVSQIDKLSLEEVEKRIKKTTPRLELDEHDATGLLGEQQD